MKSKHRKILFLSVAFFAFISSVFLTYTFYYAAGQRSETNTETKVAETEKIASTAQSNLALTDNISLPVTNKGSEIPDISERVYYEKIRDEQLEKAIIKTVGISDSNGRESRYFYNRVDLNGDRKPEVLVYVFGSMNCGTGGCDVLLFQNEGGDYRLVTSFGPVRNPVTVSENKTNNWRDLIFYNRGGGIVPGYYSVCRFNRQSYPKNPSNKEEAPPLKARVKGTEYLVNDHVDDSNLEPGLGFSRRLLK